MTTLAVRLDNDGDVLLTGPAVRALAASDDVDLLAGHSGAAAARLLPGVREVLVMDAPWSGYRPPPVDAAALTELVARLAARQYDRAVIFTSSHQSPLPMALLAKMAGIGHVAATSVDYPGSLLDVRHRRPEGRHEVEAALDLVRAAGAELPPGDDGRLAVRRPLPDITPLLPSPTTQRARGEHGKHATGAESRPYVVLHPGASVPARAIAPDHARTIAVALADAGWDVAVTGGPDEPAPAAGQGIHDLTGRTDLPRLAAVLDGAECVVVGNTGPAHLAAAVGTPVVSLFSPVVPVERWAPYGVPTVVLGDQLAACAGTRARECPVPGHPCLTGIRPQQVVDAVASLVPQEVMA